MIDQRRNNSHEAHGLRGKQDAAFQACLATAGLSRARQVGSGSWRGELFKSLSLNIRCVVITDVTVLPQFVGLRSAPAYPLPTLR